MKVLNRGRAAGALLILMVLLGAGDPGGKLAFAQSASQSPAAEAKQTPIDEYDRTAQVWYYQRMGKSGWERGQEIYYMKCWICHNDYTRKAVPATAAPTLRDLYKRPRLIYGQPVNDQTVTAQIRKGSAGMPSYGAVLNDKDLSDLVTYLREKCCWDEMNPPANPRYHPQ
jgi:mono/diheme cytochrome c family protein